VDFFNTQGKNVVFALLHFQTLGVFENAGTSLCRTPFVEKLRFSTNC
jgi:hypothetical protein